jgi:hypothetical protein
MVLEEAGEQDGRDVGHAHGHPRMAGIGALYGVHTKCADGIGKIARGGGRGNVHARVLGDCRKAVTAKIGVKKFLSDCC